MQYLNTISALKGQSVTAGQKYHPGQWIQEGYNNEPVRKGVFMGRIKSSGEDVIVWDLGQPRSEFRHLMRVQRQFVIESNRVGRTMKNLFGYLTRILG